MFWMAVCFGIVGAYSSFLGYLVSMVGRCCSLGVCYFMDDGLFMDDGICLMNGIVFLFSISLLIGHSSLAF